MAVREFNGVGTTGDYLQFDNGGVGAINNGTIPVSILMVVEPLEIAATDPYISINAAGAIQSLCAMYYAPSGTQLSWGGDDPDADVGVSVGVTEDQWQVLGMTKDVGFVQPRMHRKRLGSGSWTHSSPGASVASSSAGDPAVNIRLARFGNDAITERTAMRVAVAAIWQRVLSDAEYETIETAASTAAIMALSPDWVVELNQTDVTTTILDLTSGNGDQTVRVGTTIVTTDDPAWTFLTFPTTGILDNFDRANEDPMTTNWTAPLFPGELSPALISNAMHGYNGTPSTQADAWYDVSNFGPDCEVYATMVAAVPVTDHMELWLRTASEGTSNTTGYFLRYSPSAGTDSITIQRADIGSDGALGATISQDVSAGDSLGLSAVGSTITAWYKPAAGSWTSLGARTDSTYTAAGKLAVRFIEGGDPSTGIWDDFGGGTVVEEEGGTFPTSPPATSGL